jgi:DNA polymerase
MIPVVCDFETASGCDLKVAGAARYAEDPTTEVICFTFAQYFWSPYDRQHEDKLHEVAGSPDYLFVAHNAFFEKSIWRNIMVPQFHFPDIPDDRWHDTMASCAMKNLPLSLDRAAIVLRLPYQKDTAGSRLTKSLSKPKKDGSFDRSAETLGRVYAYNQADIAATAALHRRVSVLPRDEQAVWQLDQRINQRGVRLDLGFVRAAQRVVDRASGPLGQEFAALTGGLSFNQVGKVGEWVKARGVDLPNLQKETVDAALALSDDSEDESLSDEHGDDPVGHDPGLPDDVRRALEIRRLIGSASVKKLRAMDRCVCADGRARGLLQYHGAGTGRWAGRLLQPQNFPRGTLKDITPEQAVDAIMTEDPDWVEMVLGKPPVEAVLSSLRHALIPGEGKVFAAGDFAQIEARIVLALAGQWDKVELLAKGEDPYLSLAMRVYHRPLTKADGKERQVGKSGVLGLGFGMGWARFQGWVQKSSAITLAEDLCRSVVDTYRKEWAPEVPKLWYALMDAATSAVWDRRPREAYGVRYEVEDGFLTALLPSGSKLYYWNPQPTKEAMPWNPDDVRPGFTYQAMKSGQWRTIKAFGGLLCENVVQALARDVMVHTMFLCEKEGLPVVLTVHDEVVTEPDEFCNTWEDSGKVLEQIMSDIPPWAKGLNIPVKAETWVGDRYRK